MGNISKEANNVLEAIKKYGPVRSSELVKILHVSAKTIHKHLRFLVAEELITKTGNTPRVFYSVASKPENGAIVLDEMDRIIESEYIYVSPNGLMRRGVDGFQAWCKKNSLDFGKEKELFSKKIKIIRKIKKNGLISAKKIILSGKGRLNLDEIFFSDFYTIDHFGKTKLGQLVYLGKISQNPELIGEVVKNTKSAIIGIIEKFKIKNICFVPPTIERKVQFLDVMKKKLNLGLPEISAVKISSTMKVAQKTLRKLEDRIENAQKTIAIDPSQKISSNVLIIDDATGSGATLNETAKKIRNIAGDSIKIIGYSVVGSYKGFDVISEV